MQNQFTLDPLTKRRTRVFSTPEILVESNGLQERRSIGTMRAPQVVDGMTVLYRPTPPSFKASFFLDEEMTQPAMDKDGIPALPGRMVFFLVEFERRVSGRPMIDLVGAAGVVASCEAEPSRSDGLLFKGSLYLGGPVLEGVAHLVPHGTDDFGFVF